jgi:hypothetical protein
MQNDKQSTAFKAQIAKNQHQATLSIKGSVNANQQAIAKGIKEVRKLGHEGSNAEAFDRFNKLLAKFPVAGKYARCSQCETDTPHDKGRECLLCGKVG